MHRGKVNHALSHRGLFPFAQLGLGLTVTELTQLGVAQTFAPSLAGYSPAPLNGLRHNSAAMSLWL